MASEASNTLPKRLTCGLLTTFRYDWASEIVAACPGLDVVTIDPSVLGLARAPNPFGLRIENRCSAVVVSNIWLRWLTEQHPGSVDDVLRRLARQGGVLIGLDSADDFGLGFEPDDLAQFEVILKPQGVYRDSDHYNYILGAWAPGVNWTQKNTPRAPKFRDVDLEKVRLSVPCFMTDFPPIRRVARAREQGLATTRRKQLSIKEQILREAGDRSFMNLLRCAPLRGPTRNMDAHCVVSLTHVQRLDALQALEGLSGMRGITTIPNFVAGVTTQQQWSPQKREQIVQAAEPYRRATIGRARYLLGLTQHRIAVAPTGYGELGNRHAAVMFAGAALVCQDLSHVEMMYPIEDDRNAIFCRPDLSDLRNRVDHFLNAEDERRMIAKRGRSSLIAWSRSWRRHLYEGIEQHIRRAIS